MGCCFMARQREPSKDKARLLIPQAIAEGWGCERLASEAGVSSEVSLALLRDYSRKIEAKVEHELGFHVEAMRRVATSERSKVTARLQNIGAFADSLLKSAEIELSMIQGEQFAASETCIPAVSEGQPGSECGERDSRGLRIAQIERLATVLAKVGKAGESSWALFRSASGLALAERLTEASVRAKVTAKSETVEVWEADFELLPSSSD